MDLRCLPAALLLLTVACAQAQDASAPVGHASAPPAPPQAVLAGLPALPAFGPAVPRAASLATLSLPGDGEWDAGGPVALGAGIAGFFPGPGELSWTIYEFPAKDCDLVNALSLANTQPSGSLWIGISDYDAMRWELRSSSSADASFSFTAPRGKYSNGTSCYVAVIAYDDSDFDLSALGLEIEERVPPTDYIATFGDAANQVFECLKLDGQGNILVAGKENTLPPPGQQQNYFFHNVLFGKFSQDGAPAFVKRWVNDTELSVSDMALDSAGNAFLLIQFRERPRDAGVVKLDPAGAVQYAVRLEVDDGTGGYGAPHSLVLDGDDCPYIFGYVNPDEYLIRLDESGAIDWAKTWPRTYDGNPYLDFYQGRSLVLSGGTLYALGQTDNGDQALLLNFGLDGSLNWQKKWSSSGGGDYNNFRLLANPAGGLTFAGYYSTTLFDTDFELLGFDASGNLSGGQGYDAEEFHIADALYSPDGKLTLVNFGSSGSPQYYGDLQIIRFDTDYAVIDSIAGTARISCGTYACAAYDAQGRLYIAGNSEDPACLNWLAQPMLPQAINITVESADVAVSTATYSESTLPFTLEDIADSPEVGDVDGLLLRLAQ